jgi:DNA recombination protein RmuC
VFLVARQARGMQHLRLLAEQALAGARAEAETTRATVRAAETESIRRLTELRGGFDLATEQLRTVLSREQGELRLALAESQRLAGALIAGQFETTRAMLETKLVDIQKSVNEQLHEAVEKQMRTSFERVIDQFAAVQKAMTDVQAVTAQIGDIKRLFGNVKTRGGWGEAQVRAMLDDVLPPGTYHANWKIRPDSDDMVEFAVIMPMRGDKDHRPLLPIDAKFPVEDYERLLAASDAGDAEGERAASRGLDRRIRDEARKIHAKYIYPPVTVEFAILYLPTDSLYAEVARIPGLIDDVGRDFKVLVMGPSLFPALLKTVHLGFVTLALEQNVDLIRGLLGATRTEMQRMDAVLDRLSKNAGTMSKTIDDARRRTRSVSRKLREVELLDSSAAGKLLELDAGDVGDEETEI